jgi:hypothetical protein
VLHLLTASLICASEAHSCGAVADILLLLALMFSSPLWPSVHCALRNALFFREELFVVFC